jgi:hypothetical protein
LQFFEKKNPVINEYPEIIHKNPFYYLILKKNLQIFRFLCVKKQSRQETKFQLIPSLFIMNNPFIILFLGYFGSDGFGRIFLNSLEFLETPATPNPNHPTLDSPTKFPAKNFFKLSISAHLLTPENQLNCSYDPFFCSAFF